ARHRIVTAGVKENEVDALARLHLGQHDLHVDGVEGEVSGFHQLGVDRNEVVLAGNLDTVTGVEEQRDPGAIELVAEGADVLLHAAAVEVDALDDIEADFAQRLRDVCGVVLRVDQLGSGRICAIADDQRHALLGEGRHGGKNSRQKAEARGKEAKTSHDL